MNKTKAFSIAAALAMIVSLSGCEGKWTFFSPLSETATEKSGSIKDTTPKDAPIANNEPKPSTIPNELKSTANTGAPSNTTTTTETTGNSGTSSIQFINDNNFGVIPAPSQPGN